MDTKIEAIYLLNTSIEKLYILDYIGTRVFLNLKALKLKNLAELHNLIKEGKTTQLRNFGQKSIDEINSLFSRANIDLPKTW